MITKIKIKKGWFMRKTIFFLIIIFTLSIAGIVISDNDLDCETACKNLWDKCSDMRTENEQDMTLEDFLPSCVEECSADATPEQVECVINAKNCEEVMGCFDVN
jgi:hypothetical protein